ncbi:Uncharacterized protein ALO94_02765 [Pseudomonas syringae pv. spinaceae]|uniref:Uncharacterized protein n=1 Tax=Pseudomonas syringae pv. spinaceae TaxID=264459 RepID=A0A0Q0CLI8_PSESX|nr:Uncharacterized protein ALO94_02765 [Pseudomonas syringae pv. spinaceae]
MSRFVRERARQALRLGQREGVWLVMRDAGRRAAGNVAGQQWMIDVEEQWQQRQYTLLTRRHDFEGARVSPVIERQEAVTQLAENLAVNALIQIGANFRITRHRNSRHLADAGMDLLSKRAKKVCSREKRIQSVCYSGTNFLYRLAFR